MAIWVLGGLGAACVFAAAQGRETAQDAMLRGRAAYEDGLYPLAERYFERAQELAKSDAERRAAILWRARTLADRRRFDEAEHLLSELAREAFAYEVRLQVYGVWARTRLMADRPGDAIELLGTLRLQTRPHPAEIEVLRVLAAALARMGSVDESLAVYTFLDDRFPSHPEAGAWRLDAAALWAEAGDGEAAAALLERIIAEQPDTIDGTRALLRRARLALDSGQLDEALRWAHSLLDRDSAPSHFRGEACLVVAAVHERQGDLARARAAVERALGLLERADALRRARHTLARLMVMMDEVESGRALIHELVREAPDDPLSAESHRFLGWELGRRGLWEEALKEFDRQLEAFSDPKVRVEALRGRGRSLMALRRYSEAAQALERALELPHPADHETELLMLAGDARFAEGQYELALGWYRRVSEHGRAGADASRAAYQAAECLRRLRRWPEALEAFAEVRRRWPQSLEATASWLGTAAVEQDLGRWSKAAEAYTNLLGDAPDSPLRARALLGRGLVRYRMNDFGRALEDFQLVEQQFGHTPEAEQAAAFRVWSLQLLGRVEEALSESRRLARERPNSPWSAELLFWAGEQHFNHGRWVEAEQCFMELVTQQPAHRLSDRALYWAGRSAAAAREFRRAIELWARLAADYPSSPLVAEARYAQGDALTELGEFATALLAYETVVKEFPEHYLVASAWGRMGDCHFTLGSNDATRYPEALDCYRKALESPMATEDMRAQAEFKIGRCLERMGRLEEALLHYMNVVYGQAQARGEGRAGSAVWFTRAAFAAASLLEQQSRWREAVAVYRRVAELGGPAAEDARERMGRIQREYWRLF